MDKGAKVERAEKDGRKKEGLVCCVLCGGGLCVVCMAQKEQLRWEPLL